MDSVDITTIDGTPVTLLFSQLASEPYAKMAYRSEGVPSGHWLLHARSSGAEERVLEVSSETAATVLKQYHAWLQMEKARTA